MKSEVQKPYRFSILLIGFLNHELEAIRIAVTPKVFRSTFKVLKLADNGDFLEPPSLPVGCKAAYAHERRMSERAVKQFSEETRGRHNFYFRQVPGPSELALDMGEKLRKLSTRPASLLHMLIKNEQYTNKQAVINLPDETLYHLARAYGMEVTLTGIAKFKQGLETGEIRYSAPGRETLETVTQQLVAIQTA